MIEISTNSLRGLGTNICHLSMLLHSGQDIEIRTNANWYEFLLKLLNTLSVDKIKLIEDNSIIGWEYFDNCMTDTDKFFAPYFDVDQIQFGGKKYHTGQKNKRAVFIACYNNLKRESVFSQNEFSKDVPNFNYPRNKQYGIEQYAKIFTLAREAGYDVMTFDDPMSIDEKIFLLNNYCECLIGYEGGLAHLAHLLKIPCIILPWHRSAFGHSLNQDFSNSLPLAHPFRKYVYSIHLDKQTYFADSISEILNMSPDNFVSLIKKLQDGEGNNIFFDPTFKFYLKKDLSHFAYFYQNKFSDFLSLQNIASEMSISFLKKYHTEFKIGGIKQIGLVN